MSDQGMSKYELPQESVVEGVAKRSTLPRVMGIIHLAFGGFGLITGLVGVVLNPSGGALEQRFSGLGDAGMKLTDESLQHLTALNGANIALTYVDLLLSVLMVIAGVGLVKFMRWGRTCSNMYASASLLAKVVQGYLMVVVARPFFEQLVRDNPPLEVVGANGMQMVVLVSVVVSCIYPIVALVLVNLKSTRRALK